MAHGRSSRKRAPSQRLLESQEQEEVVDSLLSLRSARPRIVWTALRQARQFGHRNEGKREGKKAWNAGEGRETDVKEHPPS